jgi:hypothetical protein
VAQTEDRVIFVLLYFSEFWRTQFYGVCEKRSDSTLCDAAIVLLCSGGQLDLGNHRDLYGE